MPTFDFEALPAALNDALALAGEVIAADLWQQAALDTEETSTLESAA